jgi:type I restriction enzyme S subunit
VSIDAYATYRPSGVRWIPSMPEHWDVQRFKSVFKERDERSVEGTEVLMSVSAYTGVTPRSEIISEGDYLSRAESLVGYKICYPRDLVMNIMLAWNRGLGFANQGGIVSPAYCVFRIIDGSSPKFLDYLVRSDDYTAYFKAFSSGVIDSRLRLYPDAFGALFCALPPITEQLAIATFLDRETGKIDALVEAQRRLIELLKEKRQAVISHAVTKGLDPTAPMKDSGVEWLGEVPAHWKAGAVKWIIEFATSGPRGWSDMLGDTGAIFFQSQNIGRAMETLLADAQRVNPPDEAETDRAKLMADDVVVCITGARTGAVAHVRALEDDAYINQHICNLRPHRAAIAGRFLAYALFSFGGQQQLAVASYGLKQGLSLQDVKDQIVAVPPVFDQELIIEWLDEQNLQMGGLIKAAETAVELLQERRSALISAAVTGKIDVRGLTMSKAETA